MWITRFGGLIRAAVWVAVVNIFATYLQHNAVMGSQKSQKSWSKEVDLAPPVSILDRFPCAAGAVILLYNPNTILM